jgi:hypothetical protein
LLELWQISISLFVNATKDNCIIGICSCNAVANTGSSLFWTSKTVSNIDCTSGTGFIKEQTDDCDDKQNINF